MGQLPVRAFAVVLLGLAAGLCGCGRELLIALHVPGAATADAGSKEGARPGAPGSDGGLPPARDAAVAAPDAGMPGGPSDAGRDAGPDGGPTVDAATALRHRYDFAGLGTRIVDRVGVADGDALGGATLAGDGTIVLDGMDDFIDLPNGLVSGLSAVTFMAWLEWTGGPCWQRVLDFGSSDQGEGEVGNALTSVFVTPLLCGRQSAAAYVELGSVQYTLFSDAPLPADQPLSVALTIDPLAQRMRLYVDGELSAEGTVPITLDQIDDENAWLGRSQWVQDRNLTGRYDEFRIYDRALSPPEIRAAHQRGPDNP